MTDETTDILGTITEIKRECKTRFGYPPARVFINSAMRSRIAKAISDRFELDFMETRRKAVERMKLLGMVFVIDPKVPDDEMHFCTKQRQLIVRVKVDQQPAVAANA